MRHDHWSGLLILGLLACTVQAATLHEQTGLRQVGTKSYTSEAEADRINDLPGLGKPEFGLFSG